MVSIFFSYSHADENLRNELEKHLTALKRQNLISAWHDRRITTGQEFNDEIDQHLEMADIILFLVSSDFIASDYCYNKEVLRAMERHEAGEAVVIPVILRPCYWQDLPFGKILASTKDGKAITKFSTLDEGFLEVVLAIREVIRRLSPTTESQPVSVEERGPQIERATQEVVLPRSSNLRVKRDFTDREKDNFLTDAFEQIARIFEGSLQELQNRNDQIETAYRRIDQNRFSATIYKNGKEEASCNIWLSDRSSSFSTGILYSADRYSPNSYNDYLAVEDDGYNLYLKATMGMGRMGSDQNLSPEGAAEYYWSRLIQYLQ